MIHKSDILVIGGGIAGMSYALRVANSGKGKVVLAGDFISDPQAVEHVVRNAPQAISDLVGWGVNFDKNN